MFLRNQFTIISTLTYAEMKARYRNTVAGVLWVMLNPLIMFAVHAMIFKYILKINVDRYFIFLLTGLLPWIFINNAITQTVHSFITMRDSLLSFQIHPISVVMSKCIDQFINFIIPFIFLFALLGRTETFNIVGILVLPICFLILFVTVFAATLFLTTLQVFFRDTQYITNFFFSVMFFLTPIFYPRHLIPEKYQILVDINPIFAVINPFKLSLWEFNLPGLMDAFGIAFLFMSGFLALSIGFWKWTRNELYINI